MNPEFNWLAIIVAGLVPSILGAIYYGPLFESQWLSSLKKSKEDMVPNNMPITYGLALLMALHVSMTLKMILESMHKDVNAAGELFFNSTHTFGHGALHGTIIAVFLVCPIIVSLSLFQKNSAKNIILNVVFWIICFALMGGILDAWV